MKRLLFPFFIIAAYALLPLYSLTSYYVHLSGYFPPDLARYAVVNSIAGVFLFYWFMNQFITASRVRILESLVGQPSLIRLHILGSGGCALWIVFHFLAKGLPTSLQAWFGFSAAVLFFFLVLSAATSWIETPLQRIPFVRSLMQSARKPQYQQQRRMHNLFAVAGILVYLHIYLTSIAQDDIAFRITATAYFCLSFGLYVHHKYIRPRILRSRSAWKLHDIKPESDTVTTLVFVPRKPGTSFSYKAGQFGYLRFTTGNLQGEEHPFSFSSHPDEPELKFSIQHDGDFTARLRTDGKAGDLATIDGPYGVFYPDNRSKPILCIAGGIGIVSFLGMLKEYQKIPPKQAVSLFWLNNPKRNMFQNDMEMFTKIPNVDLRRFSRTLQKPFVPDVLQSIPNLSRYEVFICASRELTRKITNMLRQQGVRRHSIHSELFSM